MNRKSLLSILLATILVCSALIAGCTAQLVVAEDEATEVSTMVIDVDVPTDEDEVEEEDIVDEVMEDIPVVRVAPMTVAPARPAAPPVAPAVPECEGSFEDVLDEDVFADEDISEEAPQNEDLVADEEETEEPSDEDEEETEEPSDEDKTEDEDAPSDEEGEHEDTDAPSDNGDDAPVDPPVTEEVPVEGDEVV